MLKGRNFKYLSGYYFFLIDLFAAHLLELLGVRMGWKGRTWMDDFWVSNIIKLPKALIKNMAENFTQFSNEKSFQRST